MAIAPTGAIYKALVFDGESSRDYGIYITGEAVYNAPKRDVEMISIPGRNGAFGLDKGRFENIEVSYPAGIFADTETDFAEAISDFRNYLCSRKGYVRLTDEYNPNEFRMAVYKSGLEVSPAQLKAGEFEIIFDCMPQRYLTSGENTITVVDGQTITNPTLFASSPMLEVEGYGNISINGETVTLENITIGDIIIGSSVNENTRSKDITIDDSNLNEGDAITVSSVTAILSYTASGGYSNFSCDVVSTSNATGSCAGGGKSRRITVRDVPFTYTATSGTTDTFEGTVTFQQYYTYQGVTSHTNKTEKLYVVYMSPNTIRFSIQPASTQPYFKTGIGFNITASQTNADSTKSALGHPTYIDLDIGEAYLINNQTPVSLNNVATLPAELPMLKVGANEITFDNTVTDLKIVPRWWKV